MAVASPSRFGFVHTAEHVVSAVELTRPLDRDYVTRVLDDTDDTGVPARVGADRAERGLGDVEASLAEANAVLDLDDGLGQPQGAVPLGLQKVKGDSLGRARPYPG